MVSFHPTSGSFVRRTCPRALGLKNITRTVVSEDCHADFCAGLVNEGHFSCAHLPTPPPTPSQQSFSVSCVCSWTRRHRMANPSTQMLRFCRRSRCLRARTEAAQHGCCATRPAEVRSAHTCPINKLAGFPAYARCE